MMAGSGVFFYSAAPLLALAVLAPPEAGRIYECTDSKGQIVYQDEPCLQTAPAAPKHQTAPKLPPPPKPRRTTPQPVAAQPVTPRPVIPQFVVPQPTAPRLAPRPKEPPPSPGPVDSRWATPEKTLKTFVGAVAAGDRALILVCLASSAKADLGPDEEAIPLEELKELVSSFTAYVAEGDLGPFWSIRAKRSGQRPKWILFERMGTGEWKIASI
jgi:hypothetical protein